MKNSSSHVLTPKISKNYGYQSIKVCFGAFYYYLKLKGGGVKTIAKYYPKTLVITSRNVFFKSLGKWMSILCLTSISPPCINRKQRIKITRN